MADPLSVLGGVVGLLSLGIQATEGLVKFYISSKDQHADIAQTTANLENLLGMFRCLNDTLQKREFRPDEQDLARNVRSYVNQCEDLIHKLQDECKKFGKFASADGSLKSTIQAVTRRVVYPLFIVAKLVSISSPLILCIPALSPSI